MKAFSQKLRLTTVNALLKTAQHVEEGTATKEIKQYFSYQYEKDKNSFDCYWRHLYGDKNYDNIYKYIAYLIGITSGVVGMYVESKDQFSNNVSSFVTFMGCSGAGYLVGMFHAYIIPVIPVISGVSALGYVFRKMNKKRHD